MSSVITSPDCNAMQGGARERKAQRMESLIRTRVGSVGQAEIARQTCKDESKISRLMNGDLTLITHLLALSGLKVLPDEAACVESKEKLNHLLYWAKIGMDSVKSAEDLLFGENE